MDSKSAVALFIIRALGLMNLTVARAFGGLIGALVRLSNGRMYRVTKKNIDLCFPHYSPQQRAQLARASVNETGKTVAETGLAWGGTEEKFRRNEQQIVAVRNVHLFDKALSDGKGLLLLTMHLGNWEWVSSYLPQRCDLMALYKMAKMPGLEQAMLKARGSSGIKMVAGNRDGVRKFVKHYQSQQTCLIVPDQEPAEKSGVWSEFFGIPALTPRFIHMLIRKNPEGCVLNVYVKRVRGGFEIIFSEVEAGIYSEDLDTSAKAMNVGFEKCVLDAPEQYQWEYKRFKRNKEGHYKGL